MNNKHYYPPKPKEGESLKDYWQNMDYSYLSTPIEALNVEHSRNFNKFFCNFFDS